MLYIYNMKININNMKTEKPPLGIVPRFIIDNQRLDHINEGIERFTQANKDIPYEWIVEKNEILERIEKTEKTESL